MTAQSQFRTSELRRLATVLSIDTSLLTEGYSHPVVKSLKLTVHQDRQTIDHIGLQLFSPEIRSMGQSPIFDFLERYFLQLKIISFLVVGVVIVILICGTLNQEKK